MAKESAENAENAKCGGIRSIDQKIEIQFRCWEISTVRVCAWWSSRPQFLQATRVVTATWDGGVAGPDSE